jgi:hypothetical protein
MQFEMLYDLVRFGADLKHPNWARIVARMGWRGGLRSERSQARKGKGSGPASFASYWSEVARPLIAIELR